MTNCESLNSKFQKVIVRAGAGGLIKPTRQQRLTIGQQYLAQANQADYKLLQAFTHRGPVSVGSLQYVAKKHYSQTALKRLIKAGLVRKTGDQYELTIHGGFAVYAI